MSALALILAKRGYIISGSDPKNSPTVEELKAVGVEIFNQQTPGNISALLNKGAQPPIVVVSTAIPTSNPELKAAKQAELAIWHRSDVLAELIEQQPSIAIAGSHGKTTTSTVLTTLLAKAGEDPTAVIGGVVPCFSSNGHAGQGRFLVAEADESDGTLVKFRAELGVITNIELDHTDHYANLDELIQTMRRFGLGSGQLLANRDCPILSEHFEASSWWSVTSAESADFAALPIAIEGDQTIADFYEGGALVGQIKLPLPGLHNLSNALAAIAACRLMGLSLKQLQRGLSELSPPGRRFDFRGTWEGRQIVDDYAHHPSEVRATLAMARLMVKTGKSPLPSPPKRLVVVFQPHRYSRTEEFLNDFAIALGAADDLLLAPVYGAGESPIDGANSQCLANTVKNLHPELSVDVATSLDELTKMVQRKSRSGDLILAMGAGDVNTLWRRLMREDTTAPYRSTLAV